MEIVPPVTSDARLDAATAALVERSRAVSTHDDVFELEADHSSASPRLQRIKAPHKVDSVFMDVVRDEHLLAVLRRLLGPSIRLQNSKLNLKSSGGSPVEWSSSPMALPCSPTPTTMCWQWG